MTNASAEATTKKKSAKERVEEKFDLAADIKGTKIQTSIDNVKKVDGRIQYELCISGLPPAKSGGKSPMVTDSSYKRIPKIADSVEDFGDAAIQFFNTSDEDLIKMARG